MKYFDYFYEIITNFLTELGQELSETITNVMVWLTTAFMIITFPIWVLPYLIIKRL